MHQKRRPLRAAKTDQNLNINEYMFPFFKLPLNRYEVGSCGNTIVFALMLIFQCTPKA